MIETTKYLFCGAIIGAGLSLLIKKLTIYLQFKLTNKEFLNSPEFDHYYTIKSLNWFFLFGFSIFVAILAVCRQLSSYFFNDLLLVTTLTIIAQIDLKTMYIEGRTIALAGLMRLVWIIFFEPLEIFNYLAGFFLGAGLLYFISFFYQTFRNRQGLGDGDAAVLGLIGLWVGWQNMWTVLLIAALSGIIISSFNLLKKRQKHQNLSILLKTKIPFAPFLCFGGLLVYFLEETDYVNFSLLY